jgi:hypothetical protein
MSLSAAVHDIQALIASFHPLIVIETAEEERVESLLAAVAAELQVFHCEWSIAKGLVHAPEGPPIHSTSDPLQLMRHLAGMTADGVFHLKDFAKYLQDSAVAAQLLEVLRSFSRRRSAVVLAGVDLQLPPEIESEAAHFVFQMPTREELRDVVRNMVTSLSGAARVQVQLRGPDVDALLNALSGMTVNQARQALAYAALEDGRLTPEDIERILRRKVEAIRKPGVLEYFPVEDARLQLAGFGRLKEWLERARVGFTPEAKSLNLQPPRGILLVGVQGCGKSLAVKFVAREWRLPLLKMEAGEFCDQHAEESEKNLRRAITTAESMAPVVLWIDELEKALCATSGGDADSGLSRRLLGAFLTWLQEKKAEVFVAATANDLWSLPPELLRKGRFDEIFFADLPTEVERSDIFKIHLALRKQDPSDFDLPDLVRATEGYSGAEIEQAIIAALYRAIFGKRGLDTALLLQEVRDTVPLSVSRREEIERLRREAEGRFVKVT